MSKSNASRAPRRLPRLHLSGTALAALAVGALLSTPVASQRAIAGNEDDQTKRSFALPLPREATARAENVLDHLAGGRENQALTELQRLFEDATGDLLPNTWRTPDAEPSIYPTYPGAAGWARRVLLEADESLRARYRDRFEATAQEALSLALEALDVERLAAVAQRWPLTQAAETAWWALGDIEAERGLLETAAIAWQRAADLVAVRGVDPPPGSARRRELLLALQPEPSRPAVGGTYGSLGALDSDIPRTDADRWFAPLELEPFDEPKSTDGYPIQPLLVGDSLVINTSLRMFAVDAFTGLTRWATEPHESWNFLSSRGRDDFFDNIERDHVLVGAAAAQGIVVAAMQVPYSEFANSSWQGIPIFRRIPERRLFAFDAATGTALWNHVPDMVWRGSSNGFELTEDNRFEQLAMIAAPPVVAGSRVIVPAYRLQSRIEYHVACFDLLTGELVWQTQVISGQRERNMFGRAASEFVAAPVVVDGDRVIAQTELGAIASLDLLTGEQIWSSEYSQIPIRRNTSYMAPKRMSVWRVAPPVIVDGLVIATPSDSSTMIALEREDGAVRWSFSARDLARLGRGEASRFELDLLIGADRDTVYLGGQKISALSKQGGLRSRMSFSPRWEHLLDRGSNSLDAPRPLLTERALVLGQRDGRVALDRRSGSRIDGLSGSWASRDRGALVLGDGVLYSLGRYGLVGLFDWQTLVARQRSRLSASPADPGVRLDTASLYLRRARALREREGETQAARRFVSDARDLLADRFATDDAPEALLQRDRRGATLLHELLREEARILADLTRLDEARSRLREALALAPAPEALRDTLLQEERLVRAVDSGTRLALFGELESRVGHLPLSPELLVETPVWLIGEALLTEVDLLGWEDAPLEVAMWTRLARADELARRRRGEAALNELHAAKTQFGSVELNEDWTVAEVVDARIARRIEIDGREVYAAFEREAEAQLERASESGDEDALRSVIERFPFAEASRRAEEALLERGFLARDPQAVASLTNTLLNRELLDPEIARSALLRLGLLLESRGNRAFLAGLLQREAARDPGATVELPGLEGATLATLAAERALATPASRRNSFGSEVLFLRHEPGLHEPIGALHGVEEAAAAPLEIFAVDGRRVAAYDPSDPEQPAWTFNIPYGLQPQRIALDQGRVLVGSRTQVRAIDRRGRLVWQRDVGDDFVRALVANEGVLLALVGPNRNEHRILAWDSRSGVELWRVELTDFLPGATQGWLRPIVGDGHAVVFRRRFTESSTALILDLHRGQASAVVDLGPYGTKDILDECAWIQEGRLCVPRYESRGEMGSTLGVYDLEGGEELWRMNFDEDEHFYAVARHGDESFLVLHSNAVLRSRERGAVYSLDLDLKRIRTLEAIRPGELSAGLEEGRTSTLDSPHLYFVPGEGDGREVPLRILDLDEGRSRTVRLPIEHESFYAEALPRPARSATALAVAFRVQDPETQLVERTRLEFIPLDAQGHPSGPSVGGQVLAQAGGSYQPVELRGVGAVLYVLHGNSDGAARLDVYGTR